MGFDSAGMLTPTAARAATVSFATGCEGSEDPRNTISGYLDCYPHAQHGPMVREMLGTDCYRWE